MHTPQELFNLEGKVAIVTGAVAGSAGPSRWVSRLPVPISS